MQLLTRSFLTRLSRHRATPSPARRQRPSRRRVVALAALVAVGVLASGCRVNQNNISAADKLSPSAPYPKAPTVSDVAYGPLPTQRLDVYRPAGPSLGTIVYFHAGGWIAGDENGVAQIVLSLVPRGWSVVSVNYRLAGSIDPGSTKRNTAPQLMADVDRSIRYVKANAKTLGVNTSTVIASGASAGGHLAMMAAAAPGLDVDQTLPVNLKAVSPAVDAVLSFVGPTDLRTLWQAGNIAPVSQEGLLGCTLDPSRISAALPRCDDNLVLRYSPAFWAAFTAYIGKPMVPAYLGYGLQDTLVRPDTQGEVVLAPWEQAAGNTRAWYDATPNAGHNVDFEMNYSALKIWLDKVQKRSW